MNEDTQEHLQFLLHKIELLVPQNIFPFEDGKIAAREELFLNEISFLRFIFIRWITFPVAV